MNEAVKNPKQKPKVVCGNEMNSLIWVNVSHGVRVTNSKKDSYCIRQWTVPNYTTSQQHVNYCAGVTYSSWFMLLSILTHTHTHTRTPTWDCDVTQHSSRYCYAADGCNTAIHLLHYMVPRPKSPSWALPWLRCSVAHVQSQASPCEICNGWTDTGTGTGTGFCWRNFYFPVSISLLLLHLIPLSLMLHNLCNRKHH